MSTAIAPLPRTPTPAASSVRESIAMDTLSRHSSLNRTSGPTTSTPSLVRDESPAPHSKFRPIAICISSFLVIFTTCGSIFAFGVYQDLYQEMSHQPNNPFSGASAASIDIIGTLGASFMLIGAPLVIAWTRRFSPRAAIFFGAFLFLVGSMLASVSTQLWQFIVTQGLIIGLATCFSYMPAVTVAPTWYTTHRGLALGIILSGTGIGGLVWAPAMHALNQALGFRNALRVSGAITATCIVLGSLVLDWDPATKARLAVEKERLRANPRSRLRSLLDVPLVDMRVARTGMFQWQLIATALQSAAYYTPVFFFSAYARTLGYSATEGANFIAINNAFNAIGKICLGVLADRYGRVNMLLITTAISAVSSIVFWIPSTVTTSLGAGQGLFITYSIMYGTFASAYVSLFPAALIELFGPQNFASINGVAYMARGLGTLAGTPSAGALISDTTLTAPPAAYLNTAIMVACLLTGATVGVAWIRYDSKR